MNACQSVDEQTVDIEGLLAFLERRCVDKSSGFGKGRQQPRNVADGQGHLLVDVARGERVVEQKVQLVVELNNRRENIRGRLGSIPGFRLNRFEDAELLLDLAYLRESSFDDMKDVIGANLAIGLPWD